MYFPPPQEAAWSGGCRMFEATTLSLPAVLTIRRSGPCGMTRRPSGIQSHRQILNRDDNGTGCTESGEDAGHAELEFELRLTGGNRAAIGRQARVQIAVCVRGEQAKFSSRVRNDSELRRFETGFRKRRGNQDAVAVRHPRGIEVGAVLRWGGQPLLSARGVDRDKAAEVIWCRLHHGDQNRFSVRRPSEGEAVRRNWLVIE